MRSRVLYHLLLARSRQFDHEMGMAPNSALSQIRRSLTAEVDDANYVVRWHLGGDAHVLRVPGEAFQFYVAGDSLHSVARRGEHQDLRVTNWRAAGEIWDRIAEASRLPSFTSSGGGPQSLSWAPPRTDPGRARWPWAAALPASAALVAGALAGPREAGSVFAVASLLIVLLYVMSTTHLSRTPTVLEFLLTSVGSLAPVALGGNPFFAIVPLGGLVLLAVLESSTKGSASRLWLIGGAVCGVGTVIAGEAGFAAGLVVSVGGVVLSRLAPSKLRSRDALAVLVGFLATSAVALTGIDVDMAIEPSRPLGVEGITLLAATAVLLAAAFPLWALHGILFHVMPWLAIVGLGFFTVVALARGDANAQAGAIALAGLSIVLAVRIIAAATQPIKRAATMQRLEGRSGPTSARLSSSRWQ